MRNPFLRSSWTVVALFAVVLAVSVLYWTGCSEQQQAANPVATSQPALTKLTTMDPEVQNVMAIQDNMYAY